MNKKGVMITLAMTSLSLVVGVSVAAGLLLGDSKSDSLATPQMQTKHPLGHKLDQKLSELDDQPQGIYLELQNKINNYNIEIAASRSVAKSESLNDKIIKEVGDIYRNNSIVCYSQIWKEGEPEATVEYDLNKEDIGKLAWNYHFYYKNEYLGGRPYYTRTTEAEREAFLKILGSESGSFRTFRKAPATNLKDEHTLVLCWEVNTEKEEPKGIYLELQNKMNNYNIEIAASRSNEQSKSLNDKIIKEVGDIYRNNSIVCYSQNWKEGEPEATVEYDLNKEDIGKLAWNYHFYYKNEYLGGRPYYTRATEVEREAFLKILGSESGSFRTFKKATTTDLKDEHSLVLCWNIKETQDNN